MLPCSLDDLRATGMDVWCLGHVHAPTVLCRSPLIIYPGTPQGAHVNESGPHGCYLISVSDRGSMESPFYSTAPVLWVTTEVDVTRTESVEDVLDAIEAETSPVGRPRGSARRRRDPHHPYRERSPRCH